MKVLGGLSLVLLLMGCAQSKQVYTFSTPFPVDKPQVFKAQEDQKRALMNQNGYIEITHDQKWRPFGTTASVVHVRECLPSQKMKGVKKLFNALECKTYVQFYGQEGSFEITGDVVKGAAIVGGAYLLRDVGRDNNQTNIEQSGGGASAGADASASQGQLQKSTNINRNRNTNTATSDGDCHAIFGC